MKKEVTLHFNVAILAAAAMLGTQQAHVCRMPDEEGISIVFNFAANQSFTLSFKGERLVAGQVNLVEGREPTNSAMSVVQSDTATDTLHLFSGLVSGDKLVVDMVSNEGFSLGSEAGCVGLADIAKVNADFAEILQSLLSLDAEPTENVGGHIEAVRSRLVQHFGRKLAA